MTPHAKALLFHCRDCHAENVALRHKRYVMGCWNCGEQYRVMFSLQLNDWYLEPLGKKASLAK